MVNTGQVYSTLRGLRKLGLSIILGASSLLPGCGVLRYAENRANDFADIIDFRAGVCSTPGLGAKLNVAGAEGAFGISDEIKYGLIKKGRTFSYENKENRPYMGVPVIQIDSLARVLLGKEKNNFFATSRDGIRYQLDKYSEVLVPSEKSISELPLSKRLIKELKEKGKIKVAGVKKPVVRLYEDHNFGFFGKRKVFEIQLEDFSSDLLTKIKEAYKQNPKKFEDMSDFERAIFAAKVNSDSGLWELINPEGKMHDRQINYIGSKPLPKKSGDYLDLKADVTLFGFTCGGEVKSIEFLDFLMGVIGIDIKKDDENR